MPLVSEGLSIGVELAQGCAAAVGNLSGTPPLAAVGCFARSLNARPLRAGLRPRALPPGAGRRRATGPPNIHVGHPGCLSVAWRWSLRSNRGLFLPLFAPFACGGRKGPGCESGSGYAAFTVHSPSRPPAGGSGESERREGSASKRRNSRIQAFWNGVIPAFLTQRHIEAIAA